MVYSKIEHPKIGYLIKVEDKIMGRLVFVLFRSGIAPILISIVLFITGLININMGKKSEGFGYIFGSIIIMVLTLAIQFG